MKNRAKSLLVAVLTILVLFGMLCVVFFAVILGTKFCDHNFAKYNVPERFLEQVYRHGNEYELRDFMRYNLWCSAPVTFKVDDIVAFKDSVSKEIIVGKITAVNSGSYTVLTQDGEIEINHSQVVARD